MSLKGFTVPLTPQGRSALATLPPWHYSSDCTAIEYWADSQAIAGLLPPGLTPDKKSAGRAFFWFLDWQFTGSNDELRRSLMARRSITVPTSLLTMTLRLRAAGHRATRRNWAASTRRVLSPRPAWLRRR
jgi:hypothetical protein